MKFTIQRLEETVSCKRLGWAVKLRFRTAYNTYRENRLANCVLFPTLLFLTHTEWSFTLGKDARDAWCFEFVNSDVIFAGCRFWCWRRAENLWIKQFMGESWNFYIQSGLFGWFLLDTFRWFSFIVCFIRFVEIIVSMGEKLSPRFLFRFSETPIENNFNLKIQLIVVYTYSSASSFKSASRNLRVMFAKSSSDTFEWKFSSTCTISSADRSKKIRSFLLVFFFGNRLVVLPVGAAFLPRTLLGVSLITSFSSPLSSSVSSSDSDKLQV